MNCPEPQTLVSALRLGRAISEVLDTSTSTMFWGADSVAARWGNDSFQHFLEARWNNSNYFSSDEKRRILTLFTTYILEG